MTTPAGEQELVAGDVVACLAGREGAHCLDNRAAEPARVLMVSTMVAPDITELQETGELWMRDYPPGDDPGHNALDVRFPLD